MNNVSSKILFGPVMSILVICFLPIWANASIFCANSIANDTAWTVGSDANYVATVFTVAATCIPTDVAIYISSTGGVARVAIYDETSGHPNTLLDSATVSTASTGWATSTFSGGITLSTATNYWVVVSKDSGAVFNYATLTNGAPSASKHSADAVTWTTNSYKNTFSIMGNASGGGGGGGSSTTTPLTEGTSTVLYAEATVFFYASILFFIGVISGLWIWLTLGGI